MNLSASQRRELEWVSRHGQPAHLRPKALALLNLADGLALSRTAKIFRLCRASLYAWKERYLREGLEGLEVHAGRGRKAQADLQEIESFVRRSPREFGLRRTRWTLQALAEIVPSLRGFSPYGVQKALARAGFHYKRGQPWIHSPDPQYEEKKTPSKRR
jgi:transposase